MSELMDKYQELKDESVRDVEMEMINFKKEKALRCKVIALSELNLNPIETNVSLLRPKQKKEIFKRVEILFEKDNSEIIELFNEVCNDEIFCRIDYDSFPLHPSLIGAVPDPIYVRR
jgi:hypothetical protein